VGLAGIDHDFVLDAGQMPGPNARAFATSTASSASPNNPSTGDEQWWAAKAPLLARVLDETTYPTAARVEAAAGAAYRGAYSPDHAFRFGLQRVLDVASKPHRPATADNGGRRQRPRLHMLAVVMGDG
jgi:hypothetical protein